MTEGFYRSAAATPDHVAIRQDDAGSALTYGQLLERVDRLSNALVDLAPGSVVCAVLTNRPEILQVELAVTQLPLYFTPINWHLAPPEIAYILTDAEAALVVTERALLDAVDAAVAAAGLDPSRVVVVDDDGPRGLTAFVAGAPAGPPPGRAAGQRMLYTSGTTGHPKGVRRPLRSGPPEEHLGLLSERVRLYNVDHPDGVHLVTAPLYHAAPGAYALQSLHLGHTVVVDQGFEPARCLEQIERHGVTHTYMVPTMFSRLLELPEEQRAAADVSSLRSVIHTAAPCPVHVKAAMMEWFGPILYEIYGGTEGGATVVTPHEWLDHPGTVGRARPGVDLRILDPAGEELGPREVGDVYLAIPAQAFRYHNDDAKTDAARRGDHFTLGDIGYVDEDGYLYLCDRAADVIVSGGVNIYPAEVEAALLQHPSVVDAGVVGAPDPDWGERVTAFVVMDGDPVDPAVVAEELIAFCRERIARFKCPREVLVRDELPRSDVGKLLRRTLREEVWDGAAGRL